MSTFIKAKSKEHGKLLFALQQYVVGLYVCIYKEGRMLDQFGCECTETEFIESLKQNKDLTLENKDE